MRQGGANHVSQVFCLCCGQQERKKEKGLASVSSLTDVKKDSQMLFILSVSLRSEEARVSFKETKNKRIQISFCCECHVGTVIIEAGFWP